MYGNGCSMAIVLDLRSTATSLTGNIFISFLHQIYILLVHLRLYWYDQRENYCYLIVNVTDYFNFIFDSSFLVPVMNPSNNDHTIVALN